MRRVRKEYLTGQRRYSIYYLPWSVSFFVILNFPFISRSDDARRCEPLLEKKADLDESGYIYSLVRYLSQEYDVQICLEMDENILRHNRHAEDCKFGGNFGEIRGESVTLKQALDYITRKIDDRYMWIAWKCNIVNIFPRRLYKDRSYFFNRSRKSSGTFVGTAEEYADQMGCITGRHSSENERSTIIYIGPSVQGFPEGAEEWTRYLELEEKNIERIRNRERRLELRMRLRGWYNSLNKEQLKERDYHRKNTEYEKVYRTKKMKIRLGGESERGVLNRIVSVLGGEWIWIFYNGDTYEDRPFESGGCNKKNSTMRRMLFLKKSDPYFGFGRNHPHHCGEGAAENFLLSRSFSGERDINKEEKSLEKIDIEISGNIVDVVRQLSELFDISLNLEYSIDPLFCCETGIIKIKGRMDIESALDLVIKINGCYTWKRWSERVINIFPERERKNSVYLMNQVIEGVKIRDSGLMDTLVGARQVIEEQTRRCIDVLPGNPDNSRFALEKGLDQSEEVYGATLREALNYLVDKMCVNCRWEYSRSLGEEKDEPCGVRRYETLSMFYY